MPSYIRGFMIGAALCASSAAYAQINVGITVSQTGPAAALGVSQKNTVAQLPKEIAGQKIEYIVLDDADRLRTLVDATMMHALLRLQQLTQSNVCVVLVTNVLR
jgi:branched-chain amino acid transport system substrate-binding protein